MQVELRPYELHLNNNHAYPFAGIYLIVLQVPCDHPVPVSRDYDSSKGGRKDFQKLNPLRHAPTTSKSDTTQMGVRGENIGYR